MKDKMDLIDKIKSQLKDLISGKEEVVASKFLEAKAGDLMITSPDEELLVGSEVYSVDADGNNVPLADNEYILDSGIKIVVSGGKVSALVSSEAPIEEPMAEEVPVEEEVPAVEEAPEVEEEPEADDKMLELMERITKCEEMIAEMAKGNEKMAVEFSKIAEQPSVEPIRVEPSEFKSVEDKKSSAGLPDIASIREMARKNR
jgi:hypothetical protein